MGRNLMSRFPAIADLEKRAKQRIPFFSWEYLASGTGADAAINRNIQAMRDVQFTPQFMKGAFTPQLETQILGQTYAAPFGVAPVGLSGLMWPGAELILARAAAKHRIPYGLSTVSNETIEDVGAAANGMAWFQLYPPREPEVRRDLVQRAKQSGFTTLMVTVDVPATSRRERQVKAEVGVGKRQSYRTYLRGAMRPAWAAATLRHGLPRFRNLEKYADTTDLMEISSYMRGNFNGTVSWDYLKELRDEWDGPLLVKGIMDVDDARQCAAIGMDGIVVSNHGARQLDAVPASITVLPGIADAVGRDLTIVFDSGARGGLDICRALALGADFVLLGRAFLFAVAALGEQGGDHAAELLIADVNANMSNIGCSTISELKDRLSHPPLRTQSNY